MLSRQPEMSGAIIRGIDPRLETQVSTVGDSMREGKLDGLGSGQNRIILGRMLAYQLEVGVGDTVTVMTPGQRQPGRPQGQRGQGRQPALSYPRLREFQVAGIFEVGSAGARQCAGLHQPRGCRGSARAGRAHGDPAQIRRRPQGAGAGAHRREAACSRALQVCATGPKKTRPISRHPHREDHDGPDLDAHRRGGRVQHRSDPGDGGQPTSAPTSPSCARSA